MKPRRPRADDAVYVVGVTGGVASGKSTFVELLAAEGPSRVIDADRLGHAILRRGDIVRGLVETFGDDVADAQGVIRRDVLGPRAFATPEALASLNEIVHPPLVAELDLILGAYARTPFTGLVILDAALLVEWDGGDRCDEVVAVIAKPDTQVARLVKERGRSEDEARAIVARQLPAERRSAYADVILENDGTRDDFVTKSRALAKEIHARADARRPLAGEG